MTIKKPMKTASPAAPAAPAAGGGAAIASRFKLDAPDPDAKKPAGKGATCAGVAGLLALAVAGILTYILYQHWEFLMPK